MYWHRNRQVIETLLTATRSDATMYALVAYADGGIGIARDGAPLPQFYWPAEEMDDCIESFIRLAELAPQSSGHLAADAN